MTRLVVASILPEEGSTGVNTHVRQLARYLGTIDVETTLVTPFSWGRWLTRPVFAPRLVLQHVSGPASVVWYRHWHELVLRKALERELATTDDLVVYAQGPLEARAALRARTGPHQRVVMAIHFQTSSADEWAAKGVIKRDGRVFELIRGVEREVTPEVDGVVYVSRCAREAYLSWLHEAARVPNAVVENFISPPPPSVPDPGRHGDLVTTGALEVAKNHRYLLRVLAEAKARGRRLTLDVFGKGPCRVELQQLARELGVDDQVTFHGFRTDVQELLPGYRAYVHASYVESSSLAIIEAMAAELPIVAGRIGGIAELADEGVEARFWTLEDPGEAAATLLDLLEDEDVRARLAAAARERFESSFDANVVAPRMWAFLTDGVLRPEDPTRPKSIV